MAQVDMIICDICGHKEPEKGNNFWFVMIDGEPLEICEECSKKDTKIENDASTSV